MANLEKSKSSLRRFLKRIAPWFAPLKKLSRWFKPGKLWGVPVRIHSTAALLAGLILITRGGWSLLALGVGLIIHEYAHIWTAKSFGMKTERVEISFAGAAALQGDASFKKLFNDGDIEMRVAAAGPLMSAVLASFGFIVATIALVAGFPAVAVPFAEFGFINTLLGCFNMIPLFPLDGGRVLRGLLHQEVFKELEEKEVLNEVLLKLPKALTPVAYTLWITGTFIGIGPMPGLLLHVILRGLDSEAKGTARYIIELKQRRAQYRKETLEEFRRSLLAISTPWWKELGLDKRPDSLSAAKRAYRNRVNEVHPDRGGSAKQMRALTDAYESAKRAY
jgi:Zn-dependent protease